MKRLVFFVLLAACNRVDEPSPSPSPSPSPILSIDSSPDTTVAPDTSTPTITVVDASVTDARDATDATDAPDAKDARDAADTADTFDAYEPPDTFVVDTSVIDAAVEVLLAPPLTFVPLSPPLAPRMVGSWAFSKFDLSDPGTAARWAKVPATMKKDILLDAPTATLEITKDTMVTKLVGIADKKSTYTLDGPEAVEPNTLTIKTSDEGRKKIKFLDADTMRVEDLDKKDSFVTVFARKKAGTK